jgi:hypothetical protein
MMRGGRVRRKIVCGAVGALLLAGGLSGCANTRSSLGTNDSSCFLDLPAAGAAVGNHGRFVGIHLFSLTELKKEAPKLVADLDGAHASASHMCLAAYEGTLTSSELHKQLNKRTSGKFAVAVVDASSRTLLGTLLIKEPPLHFGHPHVG